MANSRPAVILAISWTETCVGLVFFALRFVSNWKIVARFRWDFAIASLTVVTQVTAQIILQLCVDNGMGRPIKSLSHGQEVQALKWSAVFQVLAIASSTLGKLAILEFLVQIRGRHEKKPWFLIILGVLLCAVNVPVLGTILGQCSPMQKLWDDSLEGVCNPGRRTNQNYSFFQASFNALADAMLATYPAVLFWKLQMKRRIKVALSVLMGLGWIAAICAAVKTYELKTLTQTEDATFAQPSLLVWASTEAWIVIVVGCVPPIRPLMERVLQRLGFTSKQASTPNYRHPTYEARPTNTNHSRSQTDAYTGEMTSVNDTDDLCWVELGNFGDNTSKEQIVHRPNDVVVTTDIVTQLDDLESRRAPSCDSNVYGENLAHRRSPDPGRFF